MAHHATVAVAGQPAYPARAVGRRIRDLGRLERLQILITVADGNYRLAHAAQVTLDRQHSLTLPPSLLDEGCLSGCGDVGQPVAPAAGENVFHLGWRETRRPPAGVPVCTHGVPVIR